ncbi:hypothetical protein P153DRAFT_284705 [Dothidotthia symphoricarpi CBS 119687]|uniref:RBR-type E3 ubiquitin transferase n=1 Tax=Dothidotthia symphoricarpi CBS 119687 TaxID=1392245 RepID=A0A6A6ANR2_9PLEO|nr:uncharacterized protein P153DRAFT_284705 [Dothidotthia symphoricarpi CBS 119687]KAF2132131.1 hypothetical protein P153DRAFT_284705 [Dothidotthia symphoricarpi CBS 119687]
MARALQEEEEEQSRKMPRNTRECAVCSDDIAIAELPSLANCAHQPQTCAECYGVWITTQLRDNSWREVKCPANECKIILAYYEIQQYAAQEIFEQYDTFTARAVFSDDPNFRWCRAEGCKSGQFHDGGQDGNIFTCAACKLKVCIVHEDTWHEGETCEEYEYRRSGKKEQDQRAQEEASLQEISKSTKKCPGAGCVYNIEKNDGCDHMTCSKCRYEFCWICLCDYNEVRSKGNAAHTDDCKYHTTRLH